MRLSVLFLSDDFEVADVSAEVGGFQPHSLLIFPVEGKLPQELHLLDAVQQILAVFRILNGVPNFHHRTVGAIPKVAECLRDSVVQLKIDFRVSHIRVPLSFW